MSRSAGEEAFAQSFQFFDFVPAEEREELRDFLYKYAHNYMEAKEYLQILKQADEVDSDDKSELFFRIQAMALQCFPLAMRRLTDDISKRSIKRLIRKAIREEFREQEVTAISEIHEHYKAYLNKGVAHQDELSVGETLVAFPDTDVIDKDLSHLENLYTKLATEICSSYIGVGGKPKDYASDLNKLLS